jgi:hypothetical protein
MATPALPMQGVLRVLPNPQLDRVIEAENAAKVAAEQPVEQDMSLLAAHIREQYNVFRRHRDQAGSGWRERLMSALRAFNGEYPADKLQQIKAFGGSEIYARLIAMKCRGASSLLRDVYLSPERAWGIAPPADPDVSPEIVEAIKGLVQVEIQTLQQGGQPLPDATKVRDRVNQLMASARVAEKKQAGKRAKLAQDKIDEILEEGGFYKAFSQFLVDLPLFPFACIKGPTVRIVPSVSWENGALSTEEKPRLFWERVSPFDLYFTPGASDIEDADVIERIRLRRADLNDLLDLPGYNVEAIRSVLDEYGRGGLTDDWDSVDSERAQYENRESPTLNRSGMINCLAYHGSVQGRMLLDQGFGEDEVTDKLRDYHVQAWLIGRHVIKVQFNPSPRKRHPYFITSFEKVPGTPVGNGLTDILQDVADAANATLRALINNMSMASGPQVVILEDRAQAGQDTSNIYPWKRWHMMSDPMGNNSVAPVQFFQPDSRAQELFQVYRELVNIADDISAIPKYVTGGGAGAGAGRTAAGLAMLMGNASKILQTVASNIDQDIMNPALSELFDLLMMTDEEGILQGDEAIRVMGVNVAVQRETQRSRQLEFLRITANPLDQQIMGTKGRAAVLRSVSQTIGIDGEEIIPSEEKLEEIEQQQKQMQAMEQQEAAAKAQGTQTSGPTKDMGPRTQVTGGVG